MRLFWQAMHQACRLVVGHAVNPGRGTSVGLQQSAKQNTGRALDLPTHTIHDTPTHSTVFLKSLLSTMPAGQLACVAQLQALCRGFRGDADTPEAADTLLEASEQFNLAVVSDSSSGLRLNRQSQRQAHRRAPALASCLQAAGHSHQGLLLYRKTGLQQL